MTENDPQEVAAAARRANERAAASEEEAVFCRSARDGMIQMLNRDHGWSYGKIANAVGVSRGLVAIICRR
jgi:DNA-directed RNA polymerase specialized sigma24 family protein